MAAARHVVRDRRTHGCAACGRRTDLFRGLIEDEALRMSRERAARIRADRPARRRVDERGRRRAHEAASRSDRGGAREGRHGRRRDARGLALGHRVGGEGGAPDDLRPHRRLVGAGAPRSWRPRRFRVDPAAPRAPGRNAARLTAGYDVPRTVAVAQLVEPRVVVPVVAGSSPVRHPRCPFRGGEGRCAAWKPPPAGTGGRPWRPA